MNPNNLLVAGEIKSRDPSENDFLLKQLFDYETVKLGSGDYCRNLKYAATSGVVCYHESVGAPLQSFGTIRGDRLGILLPNIPHRIQMWGKEISEHSVPVVRSGEEIDIAQQNELGQLVLLFDIALLRGIQDSAHVSPDVRLDLELLLGGSEVKGLINCQRAVVNGWAKFFTVQLESLARQSRNLTADRFNALAVGSLISIADESRSVDLGQPDQRGARRLVSEAIELDAANTYSPCIIPLLCGQLTCSRRKLELAFQAVLGTSPLKYLNLARMNRVHRELAIADPSSTTVTAIVAKHGFTELGRFAGAHRRLFGESPVQTLRTTRTPNKLILPF